MVNQKDAAGARRRGENPTKIHKPVIGQGGAAKSSKTSLDKALKGHGFSFVNTDKYGARVMKHADPKGTSFAKLHKTLVGQGFEHKGDFTDRGEKFMYSHPKHGKISYVVRNYNHNDDPLNGWPREPLKDRVTKIRHYPRASNAK